MKNYPFKFLDAYTRRDRDIFFGREEEIDALYEMVFQSRIIVVYGASGTGKTSLIQCGLANKFKSYDWLALTIRKGKNLNASLHKAICEAGEYEYDEEADKKSKSDFVIGDLGIKLEEAYLQSMLPIYLIFDQFEELYLLGDKKEQKHFISSVWEIMTLKYPVNMIFVIREEYLGYLYDFEKEVPQLMRKKLRVEPMNLDKVRQVIAGVAEYEKSNVSIQGGEEESIAEGIFNKIRGKEKKSLAIELPYLQVFLDKFYLNVTGDKSRTKEALFTMEALNEMGDIDDVLRDFLEDQAQIIQGNLSGKYKTVTLETIWQILAPFATLEGTKEPLAKELLYERLHGLDKQLIDDAIHNFMASRILRYSENENLYEIAHDTLALQIADKRSEEEKTYLKARRTVTEGFASYQDTKSTLSWEQLAFIRPYENRLEAVIEPEQQRFVRKSKSKRRRQRIGMGVLVIVLVIAVFVALGMWSMAGKALHSAEASYALTLVEKVRADSAKEEAEQAKSQALLEKDRADQKAVEAEQAKSQALLEKDRADQKAEEAEQAKSQALLEKDRADQKAEEAEQAKSQALTEKDRADQKAEEAEQAKFQAYSAKALAENLLDSLNAANSSLADRLLSEVDMNILSLDYSSAMQRIIVALQLRVKKQEIVQRLQEIAYVYAESKQYGKADTLLREIGISIEVSDRPEIFRKEIEGIDPNHFVMLENRYYPEMVLVPGGEFVFGSATGPSDNGHITKVDSFYIAKTETTVWQYNLYVLANFSLRAIYAGYYLRLPQSPSYGWKGDHPIVNVSLFDAVQYLRWVSDKRGFRYPDLDTKTPKHLWLGKEYSLGKLKRLQKYYSKLIIVWHPDDDGFRLPTEAEWEYAALGGPYWKDPSGLDKTRLDASLNAEIHLDPVRKGKVNQLGLFGIRGNAWEWCRDRYKRNYATESVNNLNPKGLKNKSSRVILFKPSYRDKYDSYEGNINLGFRCVRAL